MTHFETSRQVGHSAGRMFELVSKINDYPTFLPFCEGMEIISRVEKDGVLTVEARMTISFKVYRETLTTRNVGRYRDLTLDIEYLDGPFRQMASRWTFVPTGVDSCEVQFYADYEIRNRLLGAVAGAAFDQVFKRMAGAFEAQADKVYAKQFP